MAAQPPGPGLPRQAPSVKISTSLSSGIEPITGEVGDAAMEAQLAQEFERIFGADHRPFLLVEPIEQPCQQKAKRASAREERQRRELGPAERSHPPIAVEQQAGFCPVEAAI